MSKISYVKEWIQNGTRCMACNLRVTTQGHVALHVRYHNNKNRSKITGKSLTSHPQRLGDRN